MSISIALDMDGTLYDLYNKPNWLHDLRNEVSGVFTDGENLFDRLDLFSIMYKLMEEKGTEFSIISWLPMNCSPEYAEICDKEKRNWIRKNLPMVHNVQILPYGMPKHYAAIRAKCMYLVDDNREVCAEWETETYRRAICLEKGLTIIDALKIIWEMS